MPNDIDGVVEGIRTEVVDLTDAVGRCGDLAIVGADYVRVGLEEASERDSVDVLAEATGEQKMAALIADVVDEQTSAVRQSLSYAEAVCHSEWLLAVVGVGRVDAGLFVGLKLRGRRGRRGVGIGAGITGRSDYL